MLISWIKILTHDTPTIHCSNRSIKSFIRLISMQMSMHSGITMVITSYLNVSCGKNPEKTFCRMLTNSPTCEQMFDARARTPDLSSGRSSLRRLSHRISWSTEVARPKLIRMASSSAYAMPLIDNTMIFFISDNINRRSSESCLTSKQSIYIRFFYKLENVL